MAKQLCELDINKKNIQKALTGEVSLPAIQTYFALPYTFYSGIRRNSDILMCFECFGATLKYFAEKAVGFVWRLLLDAWK